MKFRITKLFKYSILAIENLFYENMQNFPFTECGTMSYNTSMQIVREFFVYYKKSLQ